MNDDKRKINLFTSCRGIKFVSISLISLIISLASCIYFGVYSSCMAEVNAQAVDAPKVNINASGTTTVDGVPFFPFGFYHVSWETPAAEQLAHLRQIAAAGFNAVHASATNLEDYGKFLDEAERLGVRIITEQNLGLQTSVNAFRSKPALLGWNLADDVEDGAVSPQDVLELHKQVKAADPNHITYISGYSNRIGQFARCSDVLGMQAYPVRVGRVDLSSTFTKLSLAHDSVANNGTVYANLQAFDWWSSTKLPEFRGSRSPTVDEVRNMTYQALLAGAKGIFYYTYYDGNWSLFRHPELWEGIQTLVPEITKLSPIFLQGQLSLLNTGSNDILAGTWTYQNQAIAVVINTLYDRTDNVFINLPLSVRSMQILFEEQPSSLAINKDAFSGSLEPLAVHIYSLQR